MPTTWNSDGSLANVQALINQAATHDGDTIALPNGTFTWSSTLTVTKAITIRGNSTTNWDAPTANQPFCASPPANSHVDNTIIMYNLTSKLIDFRATTGTLQRITGVSILPATQAQSASVFEINGNPSTPLRVDHCYIGDINVVANIIWNNAYNYGVFDHNVSICEHGVIQNGPGRFNGDQGDSAWEEAVGFGGPKFFFIENNFIKHGGDIVWGGKTCARFNHVHGETSLHGTQIVGAVFVCHGTGRQGSGRGGRAYEVYGNDFHWNTDGKSMDGSDTGTAYWYNNTFTNNNLRTTGIAIAEFRMGYDWGNPYYSCSGYPTRLWDLMDTEGNGTNVPGHSTFVYYSGTTGAGTNTGTIVDSGNPGWATGRWIGYVARRSSGLWGNGIESTTANTVGVKGIGFDNGWASGQAYEIVRPIYLLDQPGLGWGDHINRSSPTWLHQDSHREPLYSYNNVNVDTSGPSAGQHQNYNPEPCMSKILVQNRDYFNDTQLPGYTPYQYPHPLTQQNQEMITLTGTAATTETITLTWTGALGTTVDIYRDAALFAGAVPNSGTYTTTETGSGIGVSHVWEVRGNTASNDVTLV